jgi:sorting nexin-8
MSAMSAPKDPLFIVKRTKHLNRYLSVVARHPTLRHDELVVAFLEEPGDCTKKLQAIAKAQEPEYISSSIADNPLAYLPLGAIGEIESVHMQIAPLLPKFLALDQLVERTCNRRQQEAKDWRELQASMLDLGQTGGGHVAGMETWETMQSAFKEVGQHLTVLVERTDEQHMRESDGLSTRLRTFTDMLTAFKEVMDRRMRTLADLSVVKTKIAKTTQVLAKSSVSAAHTAKLEAKVVRRQSKEDLLQTESDFSIYCIWVEGRLVRTQFAQVGTMIEELCTSQLTGMRQLSAAWQQLLPIATKLVGKLDIFTPYPKFNEAMEMTEGRARLFT